MKGFKLFLALLFAVLVSFAQPIQTTKQTTSTKTEQTTKTKKPADGRTKTGDKINKALKGPNGETVYTGPKGGNYYLDKKENKVYLKQ